MDWIVAIGDFWRETLAWTVGLGLAFGLLTRLMPCNPGMHWWKHLRGVVTDAIYWFVVPLFLRVARTVMLVAGLLLLFGGREPETLPVRGLPLWQQCVGVLLIQDVLLYWLHRLFHTRPAWQFHAVHHAPEVLDWTAAAHFHPVNHLLSFGVADVAVLLLGFSPMALVVLAPFNTLYSAMVHANLNWTFGPLRHIFASPVFHRWHHTTQEAGLDKNFASTFPFLDVMFGTFYLPAGQLPEQFGVGETQFPQGFWGQFLHPFRGRFARVAAAALGIAALLGGGLYVAGWHALQEQERTRAAERTALRQQQATSARQGAQLARAAQACAANDLVTAGGILDELVESAEGSWALHYLREQCRRKCLVLTGHQGAVLCVAVSADGRHVVSGGADALVKIWDTMTGQEELTLRGHTAAVTGVAVSADGQHVVSASRDGLVKVWDVPTRQTRTFAGNAGPILSVAASADGRRIAAGSATGAVKVWDVGWGREEFSLTATRTAVTSVAVSDGRIASAIWDTVTTWEVESAQEAAHSRTHTDVVTSVAVSTDGRCIVSGGRDRTVRVWEPETGQTRHLSGHSGAVDGVAITPDARHIVSGGRDRTVRLWDAPTGRERVTLRGHRAAVTAVAVTPDGRRIVSGSRDGTVAVWDVGECSLDQKSDGSHAGVPFRE